MNKLRILHLEDNPDDACLVQMALAREKIECEWINAQTGAEFLNSLEEKQFDMILSDNSVPGIDGQQALTLAREKHHDIPFIFVSGYVDDKKAASSLRSGALDYISKDHLWRLLPVVWHIKEKIERKNLERHNKAMALLVKVVQELSLARSIEAITDIVRRAARELTQADGAAFVLRDDDKCYYVEENSISPLWKGKRFPMSACISGWVMLNKQHTVIEDIYTDPRIPVDAYRPTFVKSLAMVPIRTQEPIGAIGNYWAVKRQPTEEEVNLLQALADTTSVALENVQVYTELEKRVQERTKQLELANKELEAFSYSVSHDLRAPLRTVNSFGQILEEDYSSLLDETGRDNLSRILKAGKRMSVLIEDLLNLSKVARSELRVEKVNLSQLAQNCVRYLKETDTQRNVMFDIEHGLEALGDEGLLQIVLENLLFNAWKYSSKTPDSKIEFGSTKQPDGVLKYYVRDNGVGFDMTYANVIFDAFQRLHTEAEFPGTGVGLATVQRIIHKHGGQIWAEAEVNKGATFYFTLGAFA